MKIHYLAKTIAFLALLVLLPVFPLSALPEFTLGGGGGILLGGLFTNYTINADEDTQYGPTWMKMTQEVQQFNIGAYLFFDAAYAELTVNIRHGFNAYKENAVILQGGSTQIDREGTGSETMLGFTLLGKYPFRLNNSFLIYPLAGIEYQIALAEKRKPDGGKEHNRTSGITEFDDTRKYSLSTWNSFFIDIGAGMDFYFRSPFYFRAEFIYSFRLITNYERAAINYLKEEFGISQPKLFADPGMRGLTHGPELRLALGYRFK